jgi:hypothetical protein
MQIRCLSHRNCPKYSTILVTKLIYIQWVNSLCTAAENPRVGGSIPPLATIQIKALVENDTDVNCPIFYWTNLAVAVVFTPALNMMSARPMRLDAIAAAD